MALTVNTNVMSLNTQRVLNKSVTALTTNIERLSSGLRINSAKDDAAGLAISERMTAQYRGLNQGIRNANDGVSLAQTADGALGSITDAIQRMRELAVEAANSTTSSADKSSLNSEYAELAAEIVRISEDTEFNNVAIIGASAATQAFQIGAEAGQTISITTSNVTSFTAFNSAVSDTGTVSISTSAGASAAITALDNFLDSVNSARGIMGAAQNRLEIAIGSNENTAENVAAAISRIRDVDFAAETALYTKNQILVEAGTAMLVQANSIPEGVLSLLS